VIASAPSHLVVPPPLAALIAGRPYRPVWHSEIGSLTVEVSTPDGSVFVKWSPAGSGLDVSREASRLAWAGAYIPVPKVLDHGADQDGQWLVTAALPGDNAVSEQWKERPRDAVIAIAEGLRAMHDTLPVEKCPFTWDASDRIFAARQRGHLDPAQWHPDHADLTLDTALALIDATPKIEKTVVCHGDACAPNTLIGPDGHHTGHVDLGALGIADRWADLAIGSWSLTWNYGPGWEPLFFEVYDVEPDPDRIAYYRLLWDLTP
jgi:kanamycin kinase